MILRTVRAQYLSMKVNAVTLLEGFNILHMLGTGIAI